MPASPNVLIYSGNSRYQAVSHGGAETSLRLVAEKLAAHHIPVSYLTNGTTRLPGLRKKKINGVDVYFFSPLRWPLMKNRLFPELSDRLIRAQKRWILAWIVKKNRINIVHTFSGFPETYDVILARTAYNLPIKIIKRMAGLYWVKQLQNREVTPGILEFIFSRSDILNFVSSGLETLFRDNCQKLGLSIPSSRTLVMDIGIDLPRHGKGVVPKPQRGNGPFTVVCVARFSRYQKRQDLLIEAAKQLRGHQIRIEFVGIGPLLDTYKRQVLDEQLQDIVCFHGYLKGEKYRQTLLSADLFVLPTDYEGHSKALAEAMGMGLPIAASDVIPLNMQIKNRTTGFLIENTPEKWARAIIELSQSQDLLSQVAIKGFDHIHQSCDADQNITRYINTFNAM